MDTGPAALLVDDDPDVAMALLAFLGGRAVHLDIATDADRAVELMRTNQYCGIVLDRASGPAVLRHLEEQSIHVPVVVTAELPSGIASEEIRLLLPKPCDTSLLACTILGLCGIET